MNSDSFSMKNSLATKGVAILMMMWHHNFSPGNFEQHTVDFWPLMQSQAVHIATFCKICVSLFAFISGYGLYLSYRPQRDKGESPTGWILEKTIRTLSGYWFIVLLSWIVCTLLDNRPYQVYGFEASAYVGLWNMLVEFLGLTNLTGGNLLNITWWYMSAAVVFIILLPLICAGFEKIGCLCVIGMVLILPRISMGYPGALHFFSFFPIFCFGMVFARYDLFGVWKRFWARWKGRLLIRAAKFAGMLLLLGLIYKLYYHLPGKIWWDLKWDVFPLLLILFLYDYIFSVPVLNEVLIIFGRHATNMYLVHEFIRGMYGNEFIYGIGQSFVMTVMLLSCSLACSFIIELLKKAVHYEQGIDKLLRAVQGVKPYT